MARVSEGKGKREGELVRRGLMEGAYAFASSLPGTLHDSEQG
jgi:hypothetical protein